MEVINVFGWPLIDVLIVFDAVAWTIALLLLLLVIAAFNGGSL